MRNRIKMILFLTLVSTVYSRTIAPSYEVGTWSGFKSAAISYTFDDGCSNQLAMAVPMFDQFNYKITLFTVINWVKNWDNLKSVAAKGHEIASHGIAHTSLGSLSDAQQTNELKNSQDKINSMITGYKCITYAYPNCVTGNNKIVSTYYIASRICSGQIEPKTPANFNSISSLICGSQGSIKTEADFKSKSDNAASSGGWCVYLIHGIDNDGGYSPLSSNVLKGSLNYLNTNKDKFWVSTFGNVARYVKERDSVSVVEASNQSSSLTVKVTDNLNDSIYNIPITLRRLLPQDWQTVFVSQKGKTIESQIKEINSKKYVVFDVVPDGGDVVLSNSSTNIKLAESDKGMRTPGIDVNFNESNLTLSGDNLTGSDLSIRIYDLKGKEILNRNIHGNNYGTIQIPQSIKESGMYIVQISNGRSTWLKQVNALTSVQNRMK